MNKKLKPIVSCNPYLYHGVVGFKGGIAKIEKKLAEQIDEELREIVNYSLAKQLQEHKSATSTRLFQLPSFLCTMKY
jgi:hypothetical protein